MIRRLRDEDWITVNPWMFEIAKASFDKVIPEILEKKIKEDYAKEPEGFIVYETKEKIVGFLWFATFPEKKSAFIHAIYVDPEFRGKGISDELINYLEEICKKKNINLMELNVTLSLEPAIKFYKRRGFEAKRYYMSKTLK